MNHVRLQVSVFPVAVVPNGKERTVQCLVITLDMFWGTYVVLQHVVLSLERRESERLKCLVHTLTKTSVVYL